MAFIANQHSKTVLVVGFRPYDEWIFLRQWLTLRLKARLVFRAWGAEADQYLQLALNSHGQIQPIPALIVLHLHHHNLEELEFLRPLRSQPLLREALTIVCGDQSVPEHVKSSFAVGADFFLSTANEFQEILHLISRVESHWFDESQGEHPVLSPHFATHS